MAGRSTGVKRGAVEDELLEARRAVSFIQEEEADRAVDGEGFHAQGVIRSVHRLQDTRARRPRGPRRRRPLVGHPGVDLEVVETRHHVGEESDLSQLSCVGMVHLADGLAVDGHGNGAGRHRDRHRIGTSRLGRELSEGRGDRPPALVQTAAVFPSDADLPRGKHETEPPVIRIAVRAQGHRGGQGARGHAGHALHAQVVGPVASQPQSAVPDVGVLPRSAAAGQARVPHPDFMRALERLPECAGSGQRGDEGGCGVCGRAPGAPGQRPLEPGECHRAGLNSQVVELRRGQGIEPGPSRRCAQRVRQHELEHSVKRNQYVPSPDGEPDRVDTAFLHRERSQVNVDGLTVHLALQGDASVITEAHPPVIVAIDIANQADPVMPRWSGGGGRHRGLERDDPFLEREGGHGRPFHVGGERLPNLALRDLPLAGPHECPPG